MSQTVVFQDACTFTKADPVFALIPRIFGRVPGEPHRLLLNQDPFVGLTPGGSAARPPASIGGTGVRARRLHPLVRPYSLQVLQANTFARLHAPPCLLDSREEARVVLHAVVEPIVL